MIITCNNCKKKFNIDSSLIPEKGRLLQCNNCDHKWFFKKEIIDKPVPIVKINESKEELEALKNDGAIVEIESPKTIELLDKETDDVSVMENNYIVKIPKNKEDKDLKIEIPTNKKKNNILNLTIIFIISFIAIIIVLDTFQKPMSNIVPNIEFLLYNLYETIKDILLFFSDLI